MNLIAALFVLGVGTLNGWAIHEWWTARQGKKDLPFRFNARCSTHNITVNYRCSDETALINMMRKWDDTHNDCEKEEL